MANRPENVTYYIPLPLQVWFKEYAKKIKQPKSRVVKWAMEAFKAKIEGANEVIE